MIKNDAVLNEELDPKLMIEKLRREIQQLKDELSLATGQQKTDSLTDDDISRYILGFTWQPVVKSKVDNLYRISKRSDRFRTATTILPLFIGRHEMAATYRRVNMKALARYQIILLGEQRHIGVKNLPKVVARQCSACMGIELTTCPSRVQRPNHYTTKLCLLPITSRVVWPVPARWHLSRWGCDMIGHPSLWPTRRCEVVLLAFCCCCCCCCCCHPCWCIELFLDVDSIGSRILDIPDHSTQLKFI